MYKWDQCKTTYRELNFVFFKIRYYINSCQQSKTSLLLCIVAKASSFIRKGL